MSMFTCCLRKKARLTVRIPHHIPPISPNHSTSLACPAPTCPPCNNCTSLRCSAHGPGPSKRGAEWTSTHVVGWGSSWGVFSSLRGRAEFGRYCTGRSRLCFADLFLKPGHRGLQRLHLQGLNPQQERLGGSGRRCWAGKSRWCATARTCGLDGNQLASHRDLYV